MNTATNLLRSDALPREAGRHPLADGWSNVFAVSGVVIKEMQRRKDFYVLFVITVLITLVMGSVTVFNQGDIIRHLKEICLFLIWCSSLVITITMTARQIPAERESRTLLPLLAKPVTRSQFLIGKFLGCWWAGGIALLLFYFFFGLVCGAKEHTWPLSNYFQALTLHWFAMGIVCAMTLLGSLVFAAPSSTNTIILVVTLGLLFLGRHLNKVALKLTEPAQTLLYIVYFVVPHLELFDIRDLLIHSWEPIPWLVWAAALGYASVYAALFLGVACLIFQRKPVN